MKIVERLYFQHIQRQAKNKEGTAYVFRFEIAYRKEQRFPFRTLSEIKEAMVHVFSG